MKHLNEKIDQFLQERAIPGTQKLQRNLTEAIAVFGEKITESIQEIRNKASATQQDFDYAENHIHTSVPTAHHEETVAQIKRRFSQKTAVFDTVESLFITDSDQKLLGVVPLSKLLDGSAKTVISELMNTDIDSVKPTDPAKKIAETALAYRLTVVPVVGEQGRLLGAIPTHTVFKLMREQDQGMWKNSEQALSAFEGEPLRRVIQRLPWLIVGTIGCILATGLMASFEKALRADLAVAFFVPGIVYLADAIGTQSEAIAVRGLSFSQSPITQLLKSEFKTGLYLGIALALLVFPFIWIAYNAVLAFSVAIALICASSVATSIGFLLPLLLSRFGKDPAYGSGPVATIIQDLLSLLIYLSVINVLVF